LNGKDNWGGLVYTVATIGTNQVIESIIAPYIYFNWALENRTLNLGTGEGRIDANGSTQESTFNKRVDAWNQIVQSIDYGYPNDRISLNQFLKDNSSFLYLHLFFWFSFYFYALGWRNLVATKHDSGMLS